MASYPSPRPKRQPSSSNSPAHRDLLDQEDRIIIIKQEDSEDDNTYQKLQDTANGDQVINGVHDHPNSRISTISPRRSQDQRHRRRHSKVAAAMSSSNSPCTFADIAYAYRLYLLDDLLAEPQEIVHDWMRNTIYISQRYRQGNSVAPIELSHEIWVMDLNTGEIISTIDTKPYEGPHCLELDGSGAFITAYVENGGSVIIDPDSGAVYDSSLGGGAQGSHFQTQQQLYSSPSSCSSSSQQGGSSRSSGSRDDFIAEIDLRSGKMRRRINVAQSDSSTNDGRHIAFSAPAIRFANRSSSSGLPVVNIAGDAAIEALKTRFGAKKIYATSRNVMLV